MLKLLFRGRWIVLDQILSSGSNFLLSFVLVRYLNPYGFGAFGVAFVTFQIVLSFSKAQASEPMTIRFSASPTGEWKRAAQSSTGFALVFGVITGIGLLLGSLFTRGELRTSLMAFGVILPALLVQDAWRYAFFAQGKPERAVINDLVWVVVQCGLLAGAAATAGITISSAVFGWGTAAAVAAVIGSFQARCVPAPGRAVAWVGETRSIGGVLSLDLVARGASTQIAMFAVGAVSGLASVGYIRGGLLLFGPLYALIQGAVPFAVAELVKLQASPDRLRPAAYWISVIFGAGGLCLGVVLLALPDEAGRSILADSWPGTRHVLAAMTFLGLMAGLAVGPAVGLRTIASVRRLLTVSLFTAPLTILLAGAGAWVGGANGAAWGMAAGTGVIAVALLWQFRLALLLEESDGNFSRVSSAE